MKTVDLVTVVETDRFQNRAAKVLSEEENRRVRVLIAAHPLEGDVVAGTGVSQNPLGVARARQTRRSQDYLLLPF